jgi:hypothetical protein
MGMGDRHGEEGSLNDPGIGVDIAYMAGFLLYASIPC